MGPHEAHDLARGLQVRHVGVEIDPIEALEIEDHMVVEQVVHVDDGGHGAPPPRGQARTQRPVRSNVSHSPMGCPRRSEAGLIGRLLNKAGSGRSVRSASPGMSDRSAGMKRVEAGHPGWAEPEGEVPF